VLFCKACGASLGPVEVDRCPRCGGSCPPGSRFCKGCGQPLGATPASPAGVAPAKTTPSAPAPASPKATAGFGAALGQETLAQEEVPVACSEVVRPEAGGGSEAGALPRVAGRDPERWLAPAAVSGLGSRFNLLEVGSMGCVVALLGGFYAFGLVAFGLKSMVFSGTPVLGGYLLALLGGLAVLRGPLDRLLAPLHRRLAQVPPALRIGLGVFLPLLWVLMDSRDMGHGFLHAGFTVTVATGIGHLLFSSLRVPRS